jgi:hypothetical protein
MNYKIEGKILDFKIGSKISILFKIRGENLNVSHMFLVL